MVTGSTYDSPPPPALALSPSPSPAHGWCLSLCGRRNLLRLRSSDEVLNWAHSLILDPLPAAAAGFKLWRKLADEIELREIRRAALGR